VAFVAFSKAAFSAADDLNKLNDQLNISTEALSQYKFVAGQTGVEFRTLTIGFQRMGRRVAEAAIGTGEAQAALKELGIDAQKLNTLQLDQQFEVLAEVLSGVTDEGARLRLAFKLFDSEGVRLLRTMEGGAEAIRAYRREADSLGATLQQDVADSASQVADSFGRLRAVFAAAGQEIVRILGPALSGVANFLTNSIPRAVIQSERALVALRAGFVDIAVSIASATGFNEAAENLADLGNVYREEFNAISDQLINFEADIGEAVDASDFLDESLQGTAAGATAAKTALAALNKEIAAGAAVTESVRTPTEAYRATLETLEGLLARGRIEQEAFTRAAAVAGETLRQSLEIDPTPLEAYTTGLLKLEEALADTAITFDQYAEGRFKLEEGLEEGLGGMVGKVQETETALDEFGKSAARNIQSSFADFLFDPFGSSLKDMVQGFTATLRRMVAELAASQILSLLGGNAAIAGGITGLLSGAAVGGPVRGGVPVLVGERGPEVFIPPRGGGSIAANGGGTSVNITVTAENSVNRESASQVGYDIGRTIQDYMRRNG
jgi:hypothetical protein